MELGLGVGYRYIGGYVRVNIMENASLYSAKLRRLRVRHSVK